MVKSIDEVTEAIEQGNTALIEYNNNIRDIQWSVFDLVQDRISRINDEADFLIDLMSNKQLYNKDNGQLTDEGMATMGLQGQKYNTYMNQADRYGAEAAKVKKQWDADPFNKNLEERYNALIDKQREMIKSAEDAKNAIKDMVEEGINLELSALKKLIDKYEDRLSAEKSLYEYQKKVKKQTKEIADIEKQLSAYEGDTSEETKAKIQELKVSLNDAKDELESTQYDQYIADQQKLLDNLYTEYETVLNTRLDNIDFLVADMAEKINTNAATIDQTLKDQASAVGITLSEQMSNIWNSGGKAYEVVKTYGDKFTSNQTTISNALNRINANVAEMMKSLNKEATKKTQSASTSSASKPKPSTSTSTSTSKPSTSKPSTGTGSGKAEVGDRVTFDSGRYYYTSYGSGPTGYQHRGEKVYITYTNPGSSYPYHISTGSRGGDGDLGWVKLDQISGYATGKKLIDNNQAAWTQENGREMIVRPSDGAILTPLAKNDSVLSTMASKNIWDMANNPRDFIKNNLGFSDADMPDNAEGNISCTQNFDKVIFNMPNVKNYEQLLTSMQKDKNFESLVQSMTIDPIAGKSRLGKGKSIR